MIKYSTNYWWQNESKLEIRNKNEFLKKSWRSVFDNREWAMWSRMQLIKMCQSSSHNATSVFIINHGQNLAKIVWLLYLRIKKLNFDYTYSYTCLSSSTLSADTNIGRLITGLSVPCFIFICTIFSVSTLYLLAAVLNSTPSVLRDW